MRGSEHARAFVLRSVDFGEADRVVTLLTDRFGKVSALAKGARRSKRRFAGALEPFSLLSVELGTARADLSSLRSAEVVRAFPTLLRDLPRMAVAGEALLLVRQVASEQAADSELFNATTTLLEVLDRAEVAPRALLAMFRAQVMALCGFAPQLSSCGKCGRQPRPSQASELDPASGQLVCRACGGGPIRLSGLARERLDLGATDSWVLAAALVWPERDLLEVDAATVAFLEHRIEQRLARSALGSHVASARTRVRDTSVAEDAGDESVGHEHAGDEGSDDEQAS